MLTPHLPYQLSSQQKLHFEEMRHSWTPKVCRINSCALNDVLPFGLGLRITSRSFQIVDPLGPLQPCNSSSFNMYIYIYP